MFAQQADEEISLYNKHAICFLLMMQDLFEGKRVALHSMPFYGIFFAALRQSEIVEDEKFLVKFTLTMLLSFFECMEKHLEKCDNAAVCRFFDNSVVAMLNAKRLEFKDSMEAKRLLEEFDRRAPIHREFFDSGTGSETSRSEQSHTEQSHTVQSRTEQSHEATSKDETKWTEVVKKNHPQVNVLAKPSKLPSKEPARGSSSSSSKGNYKFNPGKYLCQGWKGKCLEEPTYALHPPEGDVQKVVYKCTQCAEHAMKTYGWTSAMGLFSKQTTS